MNLTETKRLKDITNTLNGLKKQSKIALGMIVKGKVRKKSKKRFLITSKGT